ncbi:MAG: hypothetical protein PHY47_01230 [Lachnospiraceae bacterium]|nr:hypothetical protein [Lachnospiraceae bacterium]
MKITSTLLSEGKNLQRTKDYRSKVGPKGRVPAIATKNKKTAKASSLLDASLPDLSGAIDLNTLVLEQQAPKLSKAALRDITKEAIPEILQGIKELGKNVPKTRMKLKKKQAGASSVCCLFSDWHFGKVIKTISGNYIFNSEIAYNRVTEEIAEQIIDYISTMSKTTKIDEIRFLFAGDMVDNDIIYATQRLQIDSGVAEQFDLVTRAIMTLTLKVKEALFVLGLKDVQILLDCMVGNHGRATKDSETPICSWDTAVYSALDLAVRTAKMTDVHVTFSLNDFHVTDVKGHRLLMKHHAPPTSETGAAKKVFGGLNEIFDFDFMVYGDLHHWAAHCYNGKPLLMNGSLCGYDEYAISLGVRDEWSQLVWMTNEDKPVNFLHRLERQ